jgi:hypothetical protein
VLVRTYSLIQELEWVQLGRICAPGGLSAVGVVRGRMGEGGEQYRGVVAVSDKLSRLICVIRTPKYVAVTCHNFFLSLVTLAAFPGISWVCQQLQ